jgi:LysR family glycine cleavage system transcriptional activator
MRPRLPPLNAVKAFEAAARLGSFSRAAEELMRVGDRAAAARSLELIGKHLGMFIERKQIDIA